MENEDNQQLSLQRLSRITKASESNKSWIMTKECAVRLIERGKDYEILLRKFPVL